MQAGDIPEYIRRLTSQVFGVNFDSYLQTSKRHFVGFLIDHQTGRLTRLFGNVSDEVLDTLNQPSLRVGNAAAGYRVATKAKLLSIPGRLSAHSRACLESLEMDFDAFLIADDVLGEEDSLVKAIIFHEMCHLIEDAGITVLPFAVAPEHGQQLYDSLPDQSFRRNHTLLFCGLLVDSALRFSEVDNAFRDELDLISKAMHYEYEGDVSSAGTLLRSACEYHFQQGNAPAFFDGDYLPKADSMYRNQVRLGTFVIAPDTTSVLLQRYQRPAYILSDAAYRQLCEIKKQPR